MSRKKRASQIPTVVPLKHLKTRKEAHVNGTQELTKSDIVKIIEQLDKLLPSNFVSKQGRGRRKAYSDKSILKLSILLKLCDISYRGAKNFLEKNSKYMGILELKNMPPFQTISRRVRELPLHRINKDIVNLFWDIERLERIDLVVDSLRMIRNRYTVIYLIVAA